ncbi:hypothetical protein ACFXB3_38870, partial [Streptomyces sp. NPDC059447]
MTEYPTSQEGPQPVASGGGTDEPGHGKAPIAAEAVRTHAVATGVGPAGEAAPAGAGAGAGAALPHPRSDPASAGGEIPGAARPRTAAAEGGDSPEAEPHRGAA